MKVRKLIKKMYEAIIRGDKATESKLYKRITKKSLEHKHTEAVR